MQLSKNGMYTLRLHVDTTRDNAQSRDCLFSQSLHSLPLTALQGLYFYTRDGGIVCTDLQKNQDPRGPAFAAS